MNQLFWVLFFIGALPDTFTVERFVRVHNVFVIEGCLLNLQVMTRFATLGLVLAERQPDGLAPCPLRFVSRYSWALQSVLFPVLGLVAGSSNSGSEIIVQCMHGIYGVLFLAMTAVFAYLTIRLQRATHSLKTKKYRRGMVAVFFTCLSQGSWCCFALVRQGKDSEELNLQLESRGTSIVGAILMIAIFCCTMTWSCLFFCPCWCSKRAAKASAGSSIVAASNRRNIQGPGPAYPGLAPEVLVGELQTLYPDHDKVIRVLLTRPISLPKATEKVPESGELLECLGGSALSHPTQDMIDAGRMAHDAPLNHIDYVIERLLDVSQ